jgi:protein TonB
MAATLQLPTPMKAPADERPGAIRDLHFDLLDSASAGGSYRFTFTASVVAHVVLIAAIAIVPLLMVDELVPPSTAIRAFFVEPASIAPPPPPPPPPSPGVRAATRTAPTPPPRDDVFRAPVTVPAEIVPEIDLGSDLGVEGGVPGGVEGGVAGGVVGGIVGGVISDMPAPPPPVVRVGGNIKAPKTLHRVPPVYPILAKNAHITGIVIVEAQVDDHGIVREVRVLKSAPLLDEAAVEAVKQWRYQPLLLNGQPSAFLLVITVNFNLSGAAAS